VPFQSGPMRDPVAFLLSSGIMVAVVEGVKKLALRGTTSGAKRKALHVLAGPVFLMTWPFFSDEGNLWAALVPLAMTAKFAAVGLGLLSDPVDVKMMSRGGTREEILRGPLIYGVVFVVATLHSFKKLEAAAALSALCFGDAAAETVGKRFGATHRLPWSRRKSYAGSAAFFVASTAGILLAALAFDTWGFLPLGHNPQRVLLPAIVASYVGALVESLPMPDVDNVLVPAAVGIVFHHLSSD